MRNPCEERFNPVRHIFSQDLDVVVDLWIDALLAQPVGSRLVHNRGNVDNTNGCSLLAICDRLTIVHHDLANRE